MMEILPHRERSNSLVGEPGVGKRRSSGENDWNLSRKCPHVCATRMVVQLQWAAGRRHMLRECLKSDSALSTRQSHHSFTDEVTCGAAMGTSSDAGNIMLNYVAAN